MAFSIVFPYATDRFFAAWFDLGNNREAIVGRSFRKNWTVSTLFKLEISLLWDCHSRRLCPVAGLGTCHQLCGDIHISLRQLDRPDGIICTERLEAHLRVLRSAMLLSRRLPCRGRHGGWFHQIDPATCFPPSSPRVVSRCCHKQGDAWALHSLCPNSQIMPEIVQTLRATKQRRKYREINQQNISGTRPAWRHPEK